MGKPKDCGTDRKTVMSIIQYFGSQPSDKESAFRKAAGLTASDMKTAAAAGCLPDRRHWRKIATAAETHGWEPTQG